MRSESYRRAIDLNPNYSLGRRGYGYLLSMVQQHAEAIAQLQLARDSDPLSVPVNAFLSLVLLKARQYGEAIAASNKTVELEPENPLGHWILARALDAAGLFEEAAVEAEKASSLAGDSQPYAAHLAFAYARKGDREQAWKIVSEMLEQAKTKYVGTYYLGLIYASLGELDLAMQALEKAYEERNVRLLEIFDPSFDSLRSDVRFQDLVRRIELPISASRSSFGSSRPG